MKSATRMQKTGPWTDEDPPGEAFAGGAAGCQHLQTWSRTRPDDVAGSAEVAAKVTIPVAGYETCSYGRVSFRDYIASRAIHFVQPDVAWSGGLTEGLKIAHLAQAWNLPLAPHIHGSAVAVAAAVHLLGAVSNASSAEMVFPAHPLMADLVREPLVVDATGQIELSDRPGLGLELDPKVVAKYRADR